MDSASVLLVRKAVHLANSKLRQVGILLTTRTCSPLTRLYFRVFDLKAALHYLTRVPPERQKILGLVKGKLPPDQDRM